MPDHLIRLRAAWDRIDTSAPDSPIRVDLPTIWSADDGATPIRLSRRFGLPRFDPSREAMALELVDVPGLVAIRLNGQPLRLESAPRVPLGDLLLARNTLELDVDLTGVDRGVPWGTIALVIEGRSA